MESTRDQTLAGSRFAQQEHRRQAARADIAADQLLQLLAEFDNRWAGTNKLTEPACHETRMIAVYSHQWCKFNHWFTGGGSPLLRPLHR
jgi:hypothetical protein